MDESRSTIDWPQLEADVARLFSAAPLRWDNGSKEELYAGRSSEIHRLMEAVRDPAKHILLYGERGVGKTSISNNFWAGQKIKEFVIVVHVQAYPSDNFSSLWFRVLEELSIVAKFYCKELRSDFDDVSPDIVRRELQKLGRNLMPIIIIDEFDQLREDGARELTANLLKSLHDNGINTTILLIGVADNVEELIANHQSLRRVLSLVKLERMSAGDLNEILDSRLKLTPLRLVGNARSAIVRLSCGLPYYVQTLGKFAAQNAIQNYRTQILSDDVYAAIDKFVVESGETFSTTYQRATESRHVGNIFEQMLLASALTVSDTSGFFNSSEVTKVLNLIVSDKKRSQFQVMQYLAQFATDRRGNVLIRHRIGFNYRYRFSDATMQPFIIMKAIKERRIDESLKATLFHWDRGEILDEGSAALGTAEARARQDGMLTHQESGAQRIWTEPAERPTEVLVTSTADEGAIEEDPAPEAPVSEQPIESLRKSITWFFR